MRNIENFYEMNLGDRLKLSLRTIKVRGVILEEDDMRRYRIRGIFNSIGDISVMTLDYVNEFAMGCHRPEHGEIAVVETKTIRNMGVEVMMVVSVIVFSDIYSWHMFALHNLDIYLKVGNNGAHMLNTILN